MTMTDDLVKRLRDCANGSTWLFKTQQGDFGICDEAADRIEELERERERDGEEILDLRYKLDVLVKADNARLLEIVRDALDAWDTHHKYGDPMQGHWASDARDALNTGKEPSHE
jgi:hypothetical protein